MEATWVETLTKVVVAILAETLVEEVADKVETLVAQGGEDIPTGTSEVTTLVTSVDKNSVVTTLETIIFKVVKVDSVKKTFKQLKSPFQKIWLVLLLVVAEKESGISDRAAKLKSKSRTRLQTRSIASAHSLARRKPSTMDNSLCNRV